MKMRATMLFGWAEGALMTFWERVQFALKENNLTEAELGRRIKISSAGISGWKSKGAIPRADIALKTAEVLNTTVEYLLNGTTQESPSSKHFLVPILEQTLSAGHGSLVPDDDTPKGMIELPYSLRKEYGNNLAALYVNGDSMEPTLHNGDLVVCDSLGWDSGEGIYAIRLNGNGYVKRIQVGDGKIFVVSDNSKYKTIEEPAESENFKIIGKVRFVGTVRI